MRSVMCLDVPVVRVLEIIKYMATSVWSSGGTSEKRLQPRITTFVSGRRKIAQSSSTKSPVEGSSRVALSKSRRMASVSGQVEW